MSTLSGKTLFITGASRGIGLAIGLRAARDGANIVIAAKTDRPHRVLPGTIHTAAEAIRDAGGHALPICCDVRKEEQIEAAMAQAAAEFGGIDILVNNASAISLTSTTETLPRRYDLMHQVNARGTWLCSKLAHEYLRVANSPHILNLAPPLNLDPKWFKGHVAYTMAKYGMSMCTLGMAEEFRDVGIAVNALWPKTVIATAALGMLPGIEQGQCRRPDIVADAAHVIFTSAGDRPSGQFLIDEDVLRESGVRDFSAYAVDPSQTLLPDLFLD